MRTVRGYAIVSRSQGVVPCSPASGGMNLDKCLVQNRHRCGNEDRTVGNSRMVFMVSERKELFRGGEELSIDKGRPYKGSGRFHCGLQRGRVSVHGSAVCPITG